MILSKRGKYWLVFAEKKKVEKKENFAEKNVEKLSSFRATCCFCSVHLCLFPPSQGDGHFFPMRALSEARNPLLTNEEQWEEDGIDEEPQGKEISEIRCPDLQWPTEELKELNK